MKRHFEVTFDFGMTLHQEDVDEFLKNADPDSLSRDEASAVRFLLALQWSRFTLKDAEPGLEKNVLDRVTSALIGWAQDHMRFVEAPAGSKSDLPAGQDGSADTLRKREFDVTLSHRVELEQEDWTS